MRNENAKRRGGVRRSDWKTYEDQQVDVYRIGKEQHMVVNQEGFTSMPSIFRICPLYYHAPN